MPFQKVLNEVRAALRRLRAILFLNTLRDFFRIGVVRTHVQMAAPNGLLNCLSHRYYLDKRWSLKERVRRMVNHYEVEDQWFGAAYKDAVYGGEGLQLWREEVQGVVFSMRLQMSPQGVPEGDLCVQLLAGVESLHRIGFNWTRCDCGARSTSHPVPYIARNQARWRRDRAPLEAFERAFPHNATNFFTIAALQGLALALGACHMVGIRSEHHICFEADNPLHFVGAYDNFWEILGASPSACGNYAIPVPFHVKPLSEVSAKHRKRAAGRRAHWNAISASAYQVMRQHLQSQ
jgi:uncharacterized protein VirK/YbjX